MDEGVIWINGSRHGRDKEYVFDCHGWEAHSREVMTTREACVGRSSGAWPMAEPVQLGLQMEAEEVMVVMVDATPCAARFVDS